jgi:hypothetical protein
VSRALQPGRIAIVLLTVIAAVSVLTLPPTPAAAQVPGDEQVARVVLTDVSPAYASAEATLTLRGRLENVSEAPLVDPLPVVRWSSDPVQTLDDLLLVAENPLFRYGQVDYRFTDPQDALPPGESTTFSLTVPVSSLFLRSGVYVVGVDVLATLPDGLRVFVASARTTLPVEIDDTTPVPVALLWPMAADPTLLADGRLLDETLADQISTDGRLTAILDAGDDLVTWVVDPDLVATAAAMVGGYETVTGANGTQAADAARFVGDLSRTLSTATDVRQTPSADPDVGGAQSAGVDAAVVDDALSTAGPGDALADLLGEPVATMALLVDRPVTDSMLAAYASAGARTVTLDSASVQPSDEGAVAPLALANGTAIQSVAAHDVPVSLPDVEASLAARQWMLSATAVLADAVDQQTGTGHAIAPPLRWDVDAQSAQALVSAWRSAPWVVPTPLSGLPVADTPTSLVGGGSPPPLAEGLASGLTDLLADARRLQPLFPEPVLDPSDAGATISRTLSAAWQQAPEQGVAYVGATARAVTGVEDELSLLLSPSITLSSRSGRFPITLVNDSAADVLVGVDFSSQNSSRLRVEDIEPLLLTAGEKRTISATALATANGRVQLAASLMTAEGSTVARPATSTVDVTNAGALGWTVIIAGVGLFAAALLRARLRRRHRDAASEPASGRGGMGRGSTATSQTDEVNV